MHVTEIKREILERNPWVANNLMKAFAAAKELAYRGIANPRNVALAWVRNAVEKQLELMGPSPLEFGLTPRNRKTLETLQRYAAQQDIVRRERPLQELFIDAGKVSIPEDI
jgi:4,5-dihydroxyphthalate decarboxylase